MSRVSRVGPRQGSQKQGLWSLASAPAGAFTPLSGTPPSPSARQARLMSPSHSLPEFLPVLDESSTLKAPLILPASSSFRGVLNPRPVPSIPPRQSQFDLRRCSSFQVTPLSHPLAAAAFSRSTSVGGGLGHSSSSGSFSAPSAGPAQELTQWVPHLMIFSLLCLVLTAVSVAFTVSVVEQYDQTQAGTFFQISDIHWDPLYRYHATPGSSCRTDLLAAPDRPFGQYGCDSPLLLLKTALMEMSAAEASPDFVAISGDSVAHNLTMDQTLFALAKVDEAVGQAFNSEVTKRLHALGEQEMAVLDHGQTNFSEWLASVARVWNTTLMEASDDAYDTFLKGGYYMAVLPSQAVGGPAYEASGSQLSTQTSNVAALVLNTVIYSARHRPWQRQLLPLDDPTGQLAWLQEQLHQARHWGRKVLIVGHVPPGMDTVKGVPTWRQQFSQQYMDTVLQHSDVIVGQLFGFLHRDHFTLMHSENDVIFPPPDAARHEKLQGEQLGAGLSTGASSGAQGLGGKARAGGEQAEVLAQSSESSPIDLLHGKINTQLGKPAPAGSRRSLSSALLGQEQGASSTYLGALGRAAARPLGSPGQQRQGASRAQGPGLGQWQPAVIDGGSSAAVLIAPSLSPVLLNRPAFRKFSYDRAGLLLDYTQHTANLQLQGAEKMWGVQYSAQSAYGLEALDGSNFAELSSSFFNSSGYPTDMFSAFCKLRAAGNSAETSEPYDCCNDCPNFMRCAVETSTFKQFQGCNETVNNPDQPSWH